MPRIRLDEGTADRMLAGTLAAQDAPPGYGPVCDLLATLAEPGPAAGPMPRMHRRDAATVFSAPMRLRLSAVAAAAAFCLAGSTAAFAAGLPQAACATAAGMLQKLGVHVEDRSGAQLATVAAPRSAAPARVPRRWRRPAADR